MSYQGNKSWMVNEAYDIELRNTPAGVKARDILSGKYKKVSAEKVVPFEKAPQEQKDIFSPLKIPAKCIADYNTKAKTAGAILNEFCQLKRLEIRYEDVPLPGSAHKGCRVTINNLSFPTGRAFNKKDAKVKASCEACKVIFGERADSV